MSPPSEWIVLARSRMKQAEMALQSSGRSGGDSRVLEKPAAGVLQKIATATEPMGLSSAS
jgi:hypothetical protein